MSEEQLEKKKEYFVKGWCTVSPPSLSAAIYEVEIEP
jgi:hypothetical protein